MICGCIVSKLGLFLSKTCTWGSSHSNKFCRWILSMISIVHPMIAINCQMSTFTTDLASRPLWFSTTKLILWELIELILWSVRVSSSLTSSIVVVASAPSSIVVRLIVGLIIAIIVVWPWVGRSCHSKDRIFNFQTFIQGLFFCIEHCSKLIKAKLSASSPYSGSKSIIVLR